MNKIIRSYKAIRQEKYLIILIPIALLLVPIIILIKNLVLLRFGLIHSDRIGHFVTDTALYLIDKKKISKKKKIIRFSILSQHNIKSTNRKNVEKKNIFFFKIFN